MIYNDKKYRNLESQVYYLTNYLDTEAQLVNLQIKVIGTAESAEEIPTGTYEYGNAYMVGTEAPYDMYIFTRADGVEHETDYWFNAGPFPAPGPQGADGKGFTSGDVLEFGDVETVQYSTEDGAEFQGTYDISNGGTSKVSGDAYIKLPIEGGTAINIDVNASDDGLKISLDKTTTDGYYVPKISTQTVKAQVYVKNADGSQSVSNLDNGSSSYSVPIRSSSGTFKVGTPVSDQDAANKQYVDNAVAGGGGGFSGYDLIISTNSELNAVLTADGNGGATFNNSTAKAIAIVGTVQTAYRYIIFPTTLLRIDGYKDAQIWVAVTDLVPPEVETITSAFRYASRIQEIDPNPYCVNNIKFVAYPAMDSFKYQAIVEGMSHLNNCTVEAAGYSWNGWEGCNGFYYCNYLTDCTCLDLRDDSAVCYDNCSHLISCKGMNTTSNYETHCTNCNHIIGYVRLYNSVTHYGTGAHWFNNCHFITDMSILVPTAHSISQYGDDYIFNVCTHISNIKLQTLGNPSGTEYNLIAFNNCSYITASHDENFAGYSRCYGVYNCTYVDQNQNSTGSITYSGSCKLKVKST